MTRIKPSYAFLATATNVIVLVLALSLLFERASDVRSALPDAPIETWTSVFWLASMTPAFWVSLLAPIFYISGLWASAGVYKRMEKGDAFGPSMMRGLKEISTNLILGTACALFVQPTLLMWIDNGRSFKFNLAIPDLTIGMIGLVLFMLAKTGRALRQDMETFV